jgi:hypothetical protein
VYRHQRQARIILGDLWSSQVTLKDEISRWATRFKNQYGSNCGRFNNFLVHIDNCLLDDFVNERATVFIKAANISK